MSIFDGLGNSLSSLSDALGSFINNSGSAKLANSANSEYTNMMRENRMFSLLNQNIHPLEPNPRPGQYAVTPSKPVVTVDPEGLKQEWLRRLNNYTMAGGK